MIVVDASAVADVVLHTPAAPAIEARIFQYGESLHAPHLIDVEIAQALRRHTINGVITEARGRQAIEAFVKFPIRRYGHQLLLDRIWRLRNNLSAYDAAYVALAEALRATLVTRDRRLAGAAGTLVAIEVV